MRAIWSGMLSFGLVAIPVKLFSAVEPKELSFHMLHKKDLSPIRFARVCKQDSHEVPYEDIVKGYELEDGSFVVMTDDDFRKANIKETSTIEIAQFTDIDQVDGVYFEKPYYLEPEKKSQKPYTLLVEALKRSHKVGIATFVLHTKEHLGLIRPHNNILLLEQMHFAEEIRSSNDLFAPTYREGTQKGEITLALQLIKQLTKPFKPELFKDTYSETLKNIIAAKAKGKTTRPQGTAPEPVRVRDLMETLRKSLEESQHSTKTKTKRITRTKFHA